MNICALGFQRCEIQGVVVSPRAEVDMKVMRSVCIVLAWVVFISAQSYTVDQFVANCPLPDTTGTHWILYDHAAPSMRWTDESDPAALTILVGTSLFWRGDAGLNFPPPIPAPGDMLGIIGSYDPEYTASPGTYGDNFNHTGYYWLYSEELTSYTDNHWMTDTLRPLPEPAVGHHGYDTIEVSIQNPSETRYPGQTTYDVLGYDLWIDSTGTGTPNSYDVHLGFFPIMGGPGYYSLFKYYAYDYLQQGNYYSVYHAYRLVAGPGFEMEQEPGHMTHYLSENANLIYIPDVGTSEKQGVKESLPMLFARPNPFTRNTEISFSLAKTAAIKMAIHSASGQLVSTLVDEVRQAGLHTVLFDGSSLPGGVYFCALETAERKLTEKVLLIK